MEITDCIANKLSQKKGGRARVIIGVCGRSGSGKTSLAKRIAGELNDKKISTVAYSGDWRFKLDSESRKLCLQEKWRAGIEAYLQAVNQFDWWDFKKIYHDLSELMEGRPVMIDDAYDRITGKKELRIDIPAIKDGVILYENCILGGVELLENIDTAVLLNTPDIVCLERTIKKDSSRRSLTDIAARFIITTYSENIFLRMLLDKFSNKTLVCDYDGKFGGYPDIREVSQIPVPIMKSGYKLRKRGTIFCDLDGTLIKHVPVPSETGDDIEVIEGSPEKLREFREKGYHLILVTSRPYSKIFSIIDKLKSEGIEFDQIICDLPVGPRHLINDSKDGEIRAIAHILERDKGIKSIKIE